MRLDRQGELSMALDLIEMLEAQQFLGIASVPPREPPPAAAARASRLRLQSTARQLQACYFRWQSPLPWNKAPTARCDRECKAALAPPMAPCPCHCLMLSGRAFKSDQRSSARSSLEKRQTEAQSCRQQGSSCAAARRRCGPTWAWRTASSGRWRSWRATGWCSPRQSSASAAARRRTGPSCCMQAAGRAALDCRAAWSWPGRPTAACRHASHLQAAAQSRIRARSPSTCFLPVAAACRSHDPFTGPVWCRTRCGCMEAFQPALPLSRSRLAAAASAGGLPRWRARHWSRCSSSGPGWLPAGGAVGQPAGGTGAGGFGAHSHVSRGQPPASLCIGRKQRVGWLHAAA